MVMLMLNCINFPKSSIFLLSSRNKFISFSGQIAASEKINLVLHDGGLYY